MPDIEEDYPDVGIGWKPALGLTTVLTILFALVFIASAGLADMDRVELVASFILAAGLLLLSYIDLRSGLLLDALTLPLIVLGVGYAFLIAGPYWMSIAGAAIGYCLIAGLSAFWRSVRGYEGIGLGDAKLLAAGGAWLGIYSLPVILLLASALGIITALTVSFRQRNRSSRVAIPFGPPLAFSIWIVWCLKSLLPL